MFMLNELMKAPKSILIPAVAVASLLCSQSIHAQALVYEGFDYTLGSSLQYSGTGEIVDNSVDGAITLPNVTSVTRTANWMSSAMAGIGAQTLTYTDANSNVLVTSGGQATLSNARGVRYNTTPFASTGGTIYTSYLWQTPNLNVDDEWRGHFDIYNGFNGLDARIGLGVNGTFTDTNLQVRYGATTNTTSFALAEATTYMMVLKLNYNGTGQMTSLDIWINPDDLASEVTSGAADFSYIGTVGGNGFGGFAFQKDNLPGGENPTFDEIRVGTDWDSVSVVPEPSAYALLVGMLALSAGIIRRRR
jgi:hypothetical protein